MQTPIPRPIPHDHRKDECGVCLKAVNNDDRAIKCDKCLSWIHIKCNKLTVKQYKHFQEHQDERFECINCSSCGICKKKVATNHHAIECQR